MNELKLQQLIKKHHSIKVTNTLIESYQSDIENKKFSIDPVILESRNYYMNTIDNRMDFILDDGSMIVISEELLNKLNIYLQKNQKLVEHVKKNSDNFLRLCKQIKDN